jgi:iron complex transport system ATP-binding protein
VSHPLGVRSVSVTAGPVTLLAHIDLAVEAGGWVGIIGPNGAGKSTLLRVIVGAVTPDQGRVTIGERDLAQLSRTERARLVALVPQRPQIPPAMTVFQYVLLGRTPHLGPLAAEGRHDLEVVGATLARLHLEALARRQLGTLSGGELQRAILARALSQQAPVLLLDEPTTALDLGHQQEVLELVEALRHQYRLTVLSALHDLTAASQFCDRLVLLSGGSKVGEGIPAEVLTGSTISRYFGATAEVLAGSDGRPVVIPARSPRSATARPAS